MVLGNGILSLAFCPEIMESLSIYMTIPTSLLPFKSASYYYHGCMTGNVIQPVRVRTGSYQIVLSTPDLGREKLQKG